MFKKENKEINLKDAETIIGPSIKVKGNFQGQGNIIIEGIVEGNVKTNNFLLVGNKAKITANIEAKEAQIGGEVKGNIKVKENLEVLATAKILGDVEANLISIAKGAILNGKCTMLAAEKIDSEKKQT
jgi:cytoskeletal protein CcmA (bactofilin family)